MHFSRADFDIGGLRKVSFGIEPDPAARGFAAHGTQGPFGEGLERALP